MATKPNTRVPSRSLISIIIALAIGSAPVVALLAIQQPVAAAGWEQ